MESPASHGAENEVTPAFDNARTFWYKLKMPCCKVNTLP